MGHATPSVPVFSAFPIWIRLAHLFNILFISLLMRSGLEILSALPKLYWRTDSLPGSEWLKFTRKQLPQDQMWTSMDEEVSFTPWIALPGRKHLGLGRHWHFFSAIGWLLTGMIYVALLFAGPQWRLLVPTSWSIIPRAWHTFTVYATFHLAPPGHPFNPLQQLSYFAIIYIVAPIQILTGLAMAPSISGRFPWYPRLFGGRQAARSLHFIGLVIFIGFTVVHTAMVIAHGFAHEVAFMVFGTERNLQPAVAVALLALAAVIGIHVGATWFSLRRPTLVQDLLGLIVDRFRLLLFHRLTSHQHYSPTAISPFFRVNGRPPHDETWQHLEQHGFNEWALEVDGLVANPLHLSLADLHQMPRQTQTTLHCCIQGWSAVAEWGGVPLREILNRCQPLPAARFLVFHTYDDKWEMPGHGYFYGTLDLELANDPQTLLADEFNGQPLPVTHGAPLRLRVETELGFKMVKWLRRIELVTDYSHIGAGQGGWREDNQQYSPDAAI